MPSNRFVISDIHGCSKTFHALLNTIAPTKSDRIYLLGDYIDRGRDGAGVIDSIIELQKQGYQLFPLLGNHEYDLVQAWKTYDARTLKGFVGRINKSHCLLDEDGNLIQKYVDFAMKLPYYVDLGDFFLVHAGLNFTIDDPLSDTMAMLVIRRFAKNADISRIGNKRIVYGHEPTPIHKIREAVEQRADVIPLDNGCFYTKVHKIYDVSQLGNLCCLNLNDFTLTLQRNIE